MTAFNDDPSDKKDDIERMSMADLLGMSGGGDGRVQERDDEPGSGIARLAQMVAASSVTDAKRPSLAPSPGASVMSSMPPMAGSMPPAGSVPPMAMGAIPLQGAMPAAGSIPPGGMPSMPPMSGSMPPMQGSIPPAQGSIPPGGGMYGTQPVAAQAQTGAVSQQGFGYGPGPGQSFRGGMPQTAAMEDYGLDPPKKSSKMGLFIGIGVGIIVLGALAYFLLFGNEAPPPDEDPQLAKLQAQLEDLKAQAEKPTPAPVPEPAKEVPAEPVAEAKPADEGVAAAAAEEAAKEEAAKEEEAAPAKPMTKAEKRRAAKAAKKAAAAKPKAPKPDKEKEADTTDKPAAGLGALLDNDVASGKKPAGELPKTPSRTDVKSAMQPIQAKASKCAKYSKGSVQLKIVVGNDGRVKSSTPVGGSADQTAANCVSMIARTARFPKFKDPTFSINYPITLK